MAAPISQNTSRVQAEENALNEESYSLTTLLLLLQLAAPEPSRIEGSRTHRKAERKYSPAPTKNCPKVAKAAHPRLPRSHGGKR